MMIKKIQQDRRGFVSLFSVLVVIAVISAIALTFSESGISELQHSYFERQRQTSFEYTDACLDEALMRLKRDTGYTGGTLAVASSTCSVVVSGVGPSRTITASSTVGDIQQQASMDITITGRNITSSEYIPYDGF